MRYILFTSDWHFGLGKDNPRHNQDLLDFTDFLCEYVGENYAEELASGDMWFCHGGDLFHYPDRIGTITMGYALKAFNRVRGVFPVSLWLVGNHDMAGRESLEFHTLESFKLATGEDVGGNISAVIDSPEIEGDILFVPWVTDAAMFEEVVEMSKKVKYVFGHFEFNQFAMNDHHVMTTGHSHVAFKHCDRVLTGHYHGRQTKGNTTYVGSPFPFDMNDIDDDSRGFAILDTHTGEIEYIDWGKISIKSISYKDLLEDEHIFDNLDQTNTTIRVEIPETVDTKTLDKLRDMMGESDFRKVQMNYKGSAVKDALEQEVEVGEIGDIDSSVIRFIEKMEDVEGINRDALIDLYAKAKEATE